MEVKTLEMVGDNETFLGYRMFAVFGPGRAEQLCNHDHPTLVDAENCPEAIKEAYEYTHTP